jgi:Ca2+/Na+ antiporter
VSSDSEVADDCPTLGVSAFLRRLYWKDRSITVNLLFIIVAVIAVILLFTGGFVSSLNFLLYVGIILLVLAVIAFIIRALTGKKNV